MLSFHATWDGTLAVFSSRAHPPRFALNFTRWCSCLYSVITIFWSKPLYFPNHLTISARLINCCISAAKKWIVKQSFMGKQAILDRSVDEAKTRSPRQILTPNLVYCLSQESWSAYQKRNTKWAGTSQAKPGQPCTRGNTRNAREGNEKKTSYRGSSTSKRRQWRRR